jgi:hypothetical protein
MERSTITDDTTLTATVSGNRNNAGAGTLVETIASAVNIEPISTATRGEQIWGCVRECV